MGKADYYEPGDHNAVCFECGRKFKASMLRKHWQGYWVCPEHWEARHEQDFVRNVPDVMTVPWAQPVPTDHFIGTLPLTTESTFFAELSYITTETSQLLFTE